jgi:TnpA family transposase
MEEDRLGLSPLEAEERPARAPALAARLAERLPRVARPELLLEGDAWTHFSPHGVHAAPAATRRPALLPHFSARVLAPACNCGLEHMAALTDWPYDHLAWGTTWPLREDTLKAAGSARVHSPPHLPLSQSWGSGILSSSEGQRFPVSGTTRHARRTPPPLGYGMGITFESWRSAQLSPYGTQDVPVTIRDSTYGLDELCKNAPELPIREHTTETAGATEMIFVLFDLLGYRCTPRLRDLSARRLLTSGAIDRQRSPRRHAQRTYRINRARILDWWDALWRAAGSLQRGGVTASLLVQKLQAYPQQNALARALQEYGRLVRTLHSMRWYANTEDRRRIMRQLKKGEALPDGRAALVIANTGHLRHPRGEHVAHQARCLHRVTNAVIVWNPVDMAAVVEQ